MENTTDHPFSITEAWGKVGKMKESHPELAKYPLHNFDDNAQRIAEERYLKPGEDIANMFARVAKTVASAEEESIRTGWYWEFYSLMRQGRFLPNSPTLMNAGDPEGQLSACFVLPVEDSMQSIFTTLKNTALIHKSGGGTGFNFSRLRPKGAPVKTTKGVASGPVSFMSMFDSATEVVQQGGMRRGANMGILNCDHPDIFEFIKCKESDGAFRNFNISVGISHDFMDAVIHDGSWELIDPSTRETVNTIKARDLFNSIAEMAWRTGDPGLVFLDEINDRNQFFPIMGLIEATNPCGEEPLYPYESCNLGSINLNAFFKESKKHLPHSEAKEKIDWDALRVTVWSAVRFLDNVITVNKYPLAECKVASCLTRKIGLGIMGFAHLLFKLGIAYSSPEARNLMRDIMQFFYASANIASRELGKEKGIAPIFDGYDISKMVMNTPRRNATLLTIAPTGTISNLLGVSGGLEPVFALKYTRKAFRQDDGSWTTLEYVDPVYEEWKDRWPDTVFETSHDIAPGDHVAMQAAAQEFNDAATSKTINMPHDATVEDVKAVYLQAYHAGCKGITVYRDGCKSEQVLNLTKEESKVVKDSQKIVEKVLERGEVLSGKTVRVGTSYGYLYLTLNETKQGEPWEAFVTIGKSGKETTAFAEAIGRLISMGLQNGVSIDEISRSLCGIGGGIPVWDAYGRVSSVPDAVGQALRRIACSKGAGAVSEKHADIDPFGPVEDAAYDDICPCCSAPMRRTEGCVKCEACGFSQC